MEGPIVQRLTTPAKIVGALGIGFGFFAGAGVTGLFLWLGALGLWSLYYGLISDGRPLLGTLKSGFARHGLAWLALALFVIWALSSAIWSPAHVLAGETVRRLIPLAILLPLAVWVSASVEARDRDLALRSLLAGLAISMSILTFEAISHGAINKVASPEKDPLAIAGDLGRAATATLALFWLGFACLRQRGIHMSYIIILVAISFYLSTQFGTDLNAVGLVFGTLMALLALSFPRFTLGTLTMGSAAWLVAAPYTYPLLTKLAFSIAPNGQLPLSYGRRTQMWQVGVDLISQKPVAGWGLGSASTFDRTIQYGGFDWPLIQLHPHAAPLHIWLETGVVGAFLGALAIITAGFAAIRAFGRSRVAASALVGGLTFLVLHWSFSHSIWREWMWCSLAALVTFSLILRDSDGAKRLQDRDTL
jgi:exopolysaccharide production protein ExoQ